MNRKLRVVIVAYHDWVRLDACLVRLGPEFDVRIVDNSSSETIRAVACAHSVSYTDPGCNLGFAAGVNVGLRGVVEGEPSDVLLLNPDAELTAASVRRLLDFLHAAGNEHVAAVSPALSDLEGHPQRVDWPFPSPARGCLQAFGLGDLPSRSRFVVGAVLLLRFEALLEVGLFDERFFLYAEEVDWQRRARSAGWSSAVCRDAFALHHGGGASTDAFRREQLFHAAHETYMLKWHGRAGWMVFRLATFAGAAVRAAVLRGERRAQAARRLVLYARGPRRAAGMPSGG